MLYKEPTLIFHALAVSSEWMQCLDAVLFWHFDTGWLAIHGQSSAILCCF
jgi:hypothetical protein